MRRVSARTCPRCPATLGRWDSYHKKQVPKHPENQVLKALNNVMLRPIGVPYELLSGTRNAELGYAPNVHNKYKRNSHTYLQDILIFVLTLVFMKLVSVLSCSIDLDIQIPI